MKACWNGALIAESEDTVVVEGNHYFPADALVSAHFEPSDHTSHCGWKGTANYYHVVVDGERNDNAAWVYREPFEAAREITGRVAFWKGVEVSES
ncbi:MAG: DUF427 domain-containing protein [Xanthomonadales bacterium]|jgi:uncharacterized protein (DUF427 family)|nr:DUF427 domain-containing protein [Xanthomonadales bacterium]